MGLKPTEQSEDMLEPLVELLRENVDGSVPPGVHASTRARTLERATQKQRPLRWALVPAAGTLIAGIAALFLLREPPLEYIGLSARASAEGYILVDASAEQGSVRFSDGTQVELARNARARIVEVDAQGARIALEAGRARFQVVHRPHARWSVAAGPYGVEVTGTRFDVAWNAEETRIELALHEGSVVVRGPQIDQGVRLRAGQRFSASGTPPVVRITTEGEPAHGAVERAAAPAPAAEVTQPATAVASPEPSTVDVVRPTTRAPLAPTPASSWAEKVARGEFANVVSEAEQRGIPSVLAASMLEDLTALADAARYVGKLSLAKSVLEAERVHFPQSDDARQAAFLLGRLSEESREPQRALNWYDRYLAESPHGAFAAEALGQKMLILARQQQLETARDLARAYLAQHPGGAHAPNAHKLLGAQ